MHKHREKGYDGKNGCGKVSYEGEFLQLMGIKPQHKNINRKEKHRPKGHITGKYYRKKIKYKIGRELGALTHQFIQHGFSRPVDKVFLTIVKAVDNVATGNGGRRSENQHQQIQVEQNLSYR